MKQKLNKGQIKATLFTKKQAKVISIFVWILSLFGCILPMMKRSQDYAHNKNSLCLPSALLNERIGTESMYSTVVTVFNGAIAICILAFQVKS